MRNKHQVILFFEEGRKPITGHMILKVFLKVNDEFFSEIIECVVLNIFFDGRILKFDYINNNPHAIQLGTIYAELSADGHSINGQFLGYGHKSEMLVSGKATLIKKIE